MTNKEKIQEAINCEYHVKIYFKQNYKLPQIGYFVFLTDSVSLWLKGLVRFVSDSRIDSYNNSQTDNGKQGVTRLLKLDDFFDIIKVKEVEINGKES